MRAAGLEGTIETWNQQPNQSRQEFDIKIIRQISGDNGQFAWRVDQNGKLQIARDSATLKERQVGVLMAAREHMKRGSKIFAVSYDRIDTAAGMPCYVIKTTNTINSYINYDFYDTLGYMPVKSITIKPDGEIHTVYKDFRPVDGVPYPYLIEQLELPTGQRSTIRISSIEVNDPIAANLFDPPSEQKRDYRFPPGQTMVQVPFQFIELHIFLPLTIKGKTKLWVLDSGAGATVVEKKFADELGLTQEGKLTGVGAANTADYSFATLPPFELNGLVFDSQKVAVFNLNELFMKTSGFGVGGILGYDFLSRLVTKVDYAKRMLTFYEPDGFSYAGGGVVIDAPLTQDNMFQIPIMVDNKYGGLWDLDLGAGGMSFLFPYAESHGLLARPGIMRIGFGAGGGQESKTLQFNSIAMAGFTKSKPLIDVPMVKGKGALSQGDITGNAGNDFFRNFTLYLDYKHEKVIVEKGADFDRQWPTDRSGMQMLVGDSGHLEVIMITDRTPAAEAGIQKGDKISAIDGKSIESLGGILSVREMLRGPVGTIYKIKLIREGNTKEATLELRPLYE